MPSNSLIVTSIEREAGHSVASRNIVNTYCESEGQDPALVRSILTTYDRVEIYVVDVAFYEDIALMSIGVFEDIHHGIVAATIANYIKPSYRGFDVARMLHTAAMKWCKANGITKFQRSRHIDGNRQLIITKEV